MPEQARGSPRFSAKGEGAHGRASAGTDGPLALSVRPPLPGLEPEGAPLSMSSWCAGYVVRGLALLLVFGPTSAGPMSTNPSPRTLWLSLASMPALSAVWRHALT